MRSRPDTIRRGVLFTTFLMLLVCLSASGVFAQDVDEATEAVEASSADAPDTETPSEETRRWSRNPYLISVCGMANSLTPMRILKEEIYDINDLTKNGMGIGANATLHLTQVLAFSFNIQRGGFNFTGAKPGEMAIINEELDSVTPLTPDSFLKMDSIGFSLTTYLGKYLTPNSRFNPFVTAGIDYYDWALFQDGRDTDVISYQEKPIEEKNFGVNFGLGTRYELTGNLELNVRWAWTYVRTGDEVKWDGFQSTFNDSYFWTNTHFWNLGIGLCFHM